MLEADVSLPVVRRFIKNVEAKAVGVKVTKGVTASQQLTKTVADELCELMGGFGGEKLKLKEEGEGPTVILMAGLQGVGKTTACGKLALYLKKQEKTCLLVATDVYRPAAIDQLKKLGSRLALPSSTWGSRRAPGHRRQGFGQGEGGGHRRRHRGYRGASSDRRAADG